jgi:hypothetical protein
MIFMRTNRSNPERVFITAQNDHSSTLTNGQAVMWNLTSPDGVGVIICGTALKRTHAFAGIAAESIVAGEFGLIQVWGYHSAVIVTGGTTCDIFSGCPLYMRLSELYLTGPLFASGTTEEVSEEGIGVAAVALEGTGLVGTTTTIKAIIKAL